MSIVDDAIEDGVGDGRLADDVVPSVDRDLAGEIGAVAAALLDDLQQVASLVGRERFEAPVVEVSKICLLSGSNGNRGCWDGRAAARGACAGRSAIEAVLEDRVDRAVGPGANLQPAPAVGLERVCAVAGGPGAGCRGRRGSPGRGGAGCAG